MMDQPFGMQPQRRPMGVFGQPSEGGTGGSTGPMSDMVQARFGPQGFGFGGRPRPVAPIRPVIENASPGMATAPAPAAPPANFTPRPNVPAAAGPYNYTGPTMNVLGMTDAPLAPASSPIAPGAVNRFMGGGGGAGGFGSGGGFDGAGYGRRFMM